MERMAWPCAAAGVDAALIACPTRPQALPMRSAAMLSQVTSLCCMVLLRDARFGYQ